MKKATPRRIFFASAELFAEHAYSWVSMRDVAKKAGVQAASIYNHYKSKEEILDRIIDLYIERAKKFHEDTISQILSKDYTPKLSDIIYRYLPEESDLMFWVTRIIHTEQFTSPLAADALVGKINELYADGYREFFSPYTKKGY